MAHDRVIGLDLARAIAIGLVLISHFSLMFSAVLPIGPVFIGAGYYGVELFFALSGFLIGRILIRTPIAREGLPAMRRFWLRRWLRTLPAYYLVLAALACLDRAHFSPLHLLFLQNFFAGPRDDFFGVSWSLVIEEWFYLLLPIVLLVVGRSAHLTARRGFLLICVAGIVLCLAGRFVDVLWFDTVWGDVRKSVFLRLDAILFGVLLATLREFHPDLYQAALRRRRAVLWGALGVLAVTTVPFLKHPANPPSVFDRTLLFSIVSACCAAVVFALEHARIHRAWLARAVTWLSLISYSLYLIHWDVMIRVRARETHPHSLVISALFALVGIAVALGLASLLYRLWERPFMVWRDRLPGSAAALGATTQPARRET